MTAQGNIEAATLSSAMALAFSEIEAATKGTAGQVGQQKYKYADLGSVIDAIKPALIAHGLFFTQRPKPGEGGVCIETVLHHQTGEQLSLGTLFVPANKQDAQGFGSALTYARRYGLMTAFGVPAEDDDGNAAAASHRAAPPRQATTEPRIDDSQLRVLQGYATGGVINLSKFLEYYRIKDLRDLPASAYDIELKRAQDRQAKQKKPAQ